MLTKKNIIVNDLWNKLDDLYKKIKTLESFSKDIEELTEQLIRYKLRIISLNKCFAEKQKEVKNG